MAGVRQQTFLDYDGFVGKFKPCKTTDDCYTPDNIYKAVSAWAIAQYRLDNRPIVRPFWPGKDYQSAEYPENCVVIDNPPFSLMSKITRWYAAQKIDFFLFAPYLTNLGIPRCNHVIAPVSITYENGARVDTAFVTSLGNAFIVTAPDLMDAIRDQENINLAARNRTLPRYEYPSSVVTSAGIGYLCKHHVSFSLAADECCFIRKIDNQGKDCTIYGGGYIIAERAAAEYEKADRAAMKNAAAERIAKEKAEAESPVLRWELSPRERKIQELLSKKSSGNVN